MLPACLGWMTARTAEHLDALRVHDDGWCLALEVSQGWLVVELQPVQGEAAFLLALTVVGDGATWEDSTTRRGNVQR
jgi:hypothetical protein